ncbi:hypothetical protein [Lactobacillus delbrueckii]|uniref:hypothetical protein n=1 Tax=Lactobacillus delbrueckii TaxID=1584 RepID=UPI0022E8E37C|nr:hypothetical protein [Lactobacillus delbrueckii]
MKEKNWLTVLALVVGFAAMGASVWLSAQASSVKKRLDKLASDNSSLKKKNHRLAKETRHLSRPTRTCQQPARPRD